MAVTERSFAAGWPLQICLEDRIEVKEAISTVADSGKRGGLILEFFGANTFGVTLVPLLIGVGLLFGMGEALWAGFSPSPADCSFWRE